MAVTGLASNFRIRNARDFLDFVEKPDSGVYIYLGRTAEWPDEENPPPSLNTLDEILANWRDMNGIKKIAPLDIALGIREYVWTSGTVYVQYADDIDLTDQQFFVLTDQLNVYKCISNNNGGPSTIRPTHTTSDIPLQSDGYKWRYMFSTTSSVLRKFIVPGFFGFDPNSTSFPPTQPGTIDNVRVDAQGSGYAANASVNTNTEIPVFIEGDGDQNSSATATINTIQGEITSISSITSAGSNYPYAPESNIPVALRQFNGGLIQTAYGIATTNPSGGIDSVELVISGDGYADGEVSIVQSSCRAYAETSNNGRIINSDVPVGRSGVNFTRAKAVIVDVNGTGATLKPIISPLGGHGSDAAQELLANFVLVNLRLSGQEDFLGRNEFRRVGILEGPAQFGIESDGEYTSFDGSVGDTKYRLLLNSRDNTAFTPGEQIIGETSGAVGYEMNLFETDKLRVSLDNEYTGDTEFKVGETIVGLTSGTTDIIDSITDPDIEPYEGRILYINNREVIETVSPQQIETITLVLEY